MYATNYFETKILNTFNNITCVAASELFVALFLSNPTETGIAGNEVNYTGYTRVKITFTAPYAESGGIGVKNDADILWNKAPNDVGQARYIGIYDSATLGSGNMWLYGELSIPLDIKTNQQPSIYAGDMASTVADMQDRQRIEMAYSQGATQFYQDHVYDNADPSTSLQLKLMLPSSMKIVNAVKIDVEIGPFRKPFTVTGGGGAQTISQSNTTSSGASTITTTASGGGQTSGASSLNTTDSGGYTSTSTSSGGGSSSGASSTSTTSSYDMQLQNIWPNDTTSSQQTHNHGISQGQRLITDVTLNGSKESGYSVHLGYTTWVPSGAHTHGSHSHNMQHTHEIYSHSHSFTVNSHSHGMSHTHNIYAHTHDMQHYHSISHTHAIPDHTHSLKPGISFEGNPSSFQLIINGVKVKTVTEKNLQLDITEFLVNQQNMITRDTYHKIEILPNDTAYILLTVNVQGFIQSRGDKTV